jgi:hypothetical protein
MPVTLAQLLREWHDFYVLVGTASATLVGLMFVAASIGSSFFNEEHRAPMTTFITPTVVHFAAVLFTCLLVIIPTQNWHTLGVVLAILGLAGSIYCGRLLLRLIIRHQFNVDWEDRMFYAFIPLLGYLLLQIAAVLLFMQSAVSPELIAGAILTLLLASLRNAWDMTVWMVIKAPTGTGRQP